MMTTPYFCCLLSTLWLRSMALSSVRISVWNLQDQDFSYKKKRCRITCSMQLRKSRSAHDFSRATFLNNTVVEEEDAAVDNDFSTITDEEVILACRAYLARKNRLPHGWHQFERRKKMRRRSLALLTDEVNVNSNEAYDDGTGYFWEDPSELIYLRTGKPRLVLQGDDNLIVHTTTTAQRDAEDAEVEDEDVQQSYDAFYSKIRARKKSSSSSGLVGPGSRRGGVFNNLDSDDDPNEEKGNYDDDGEEEDNEDDREEFRDVDNEQGGGTFTSYPLFPTREHSRRSNVMKNLFADPKWKARWYAKRWPSKASTKYTQECAAQSSSMINKVPTKSQGPESSRKRSRNRSLLQNIPLEFFSSQALSSLSKEEIMNAITTYMSSRRKRSHSQQRRTLERQEILQNRSLSSANLTQMSSIALQNQMKQSANANVNDMTLDKVNNINTLDSERLMLMERRRIRSEKAKRAYETRRKNAEARKKMDTDTTRKRAQ